MVLEAQLQHASLLKKVAESMKDLCLDCLDAGYHRMKICMKMYEDICYKKYLEDLYEAVSHGKRPQVSEGTKKT